MRSPGRCTNHETCWLGNGQRTIQIAIADPFCCPICGAAMVPPPIEAIAQRSIHRAIATSLILILAAGGSGFGLVKGLRMISMGVPAPAARPSLAARVPARAKPQVQMAAAVPSSAQTARLAAPPPAIPVPAPIKVAAALPTQLSPTQYIQHAFVPAQSAAPKATDPKAADPRALDIVELAMRQLHTPLPHILIATNVSQEPLRAAQQPISFGRPVPPEDDAPPRLNRWRYRPVVPVPHRTEFLPAPGWSDGAEEATSGDETTPASTPAIVQTISAVSTGDETLNTVSADAIPAPASADTLPDIAASRVPGTAASAMPSISPATTPVAWLTTAPHAAALPDYQPASRVDPAEAAQLDQAPDAPRRLATLPPARPEKLAAPTYPIVEEAVARPGRVEVGCIITPHGLPDRCHVQRELGGEQFTDAVLAWLKSGAVRYRPHVAHGEPVAEARDYRVRFEP